METWRGTWPSWIGLALLIGCTSNTTTDAGGTIIGPNGGTVTLSDGTSVQIPAGALSGPTTITITANSSLPPPDGGSWVGTPYLFGPEGTQFAAPVTVTLAFVPSELPADAGPSGITIVTAPAGSSAFTVLPTTVVDATHVSAPTTHFSDIAPEFNLASYQCYPSCVGGNTCCPRRPPDPVAGGVCLDLNTLSFACGSCDKDCGDNDCVDGSCCGPLGSPCSNSDPPCCPGLQCTSESPGGMCVSQGTATTGGTGSTGGSTSGGTTGSGTSGGSTGGTGAATGFCAWGSFGCMSCCKLDALNGVLCSSNVGCAFSLTAVAMKSFPGGKTYAFAGDFMNGGLSAYQVDLSTTTPTTTFVASWPGLSVYSDGVFGDPYLYAQARDGGTTNSIFQYSIGSDGSLAVLSPWSVSGFVDGQPVISAASGFFYTQSVNQVGQAVILDGGQLSPLTPAAVTLPGYGVNALDIAPGHSLLFAGNTMVLLDGGRQPLVSQFTIGLSGALTAASVASVNSPYTPDHISVYEPDGGGGPFVYVLGHDATFAEYLSQYTAASGTLVALNPATVPVCTPSHTMTVDPWDELLLVACTQASSIDAYGIGADGTLTDAGWSPASLPVGPGQLSVFRAQ
jgi:hypothetical protein